MAEKGGNMWYAIFGISIFVVLGVIIWHFLFRTSVARVCGHAYSLKPQTYVVFGEEVTSQPRRRMEHCPQCQLDAAIPCGRCGKPILPGARIKLIVNSDPNRTFPDGAAYIGPEKQFVVGCGRPNCAGDLTLADFVGWWRTDRRIYYRYQHDVIRDSAAQ